jgi:hypothetical protein
MQRLVAIASLTASLFTAGCNRQIENRNLYRVRTNMTQKEVESILGHPAETEKVELELETQKKTMAITRYFYHQDGQTIVLHFQNGYLVHRPEPLQEK